MTNEEYEFWLTDRIAKIQSIDEQYNLRDNAYISFSGGKDSTVLHYLIDLALPNNNIPRVFINTGLEYTKIRQFVGKLAKEDNRIKIVNSEVNLKRMLEKDGYPFKSKQHSNILHVYYNYKRKNKTEFPLSVSHYLGQNDSKLMFTCPKQLEYQFTPDFKLHCSEKCCHRLKKEVGVRFQKENNKSICLTGMRKSERGQRTGIDCIAIKGGKLTKFHPLLVVEEEWLDYFIIKENIKLCELYYPPYNFTRTGCKGCPFNIELEKDLKKMQEVLPNERKQCELIWKPVYDEYRRIGYRLKEK